MSPDARALIFADRRAVRLRRLRDFALRWWWVPAALWGVRLLWLVTQP